MMSNERNNLVGRPEHAEVVEWLHGLVAAVSETELRAGRRLESDEHLEGLKALGDLN